MNLSAPRIITWWIALVLAVIGIIGELAPIQLLSQSHFWFAAAGFVLLALGTLFEGL